MRDFVYTNKSIEECYGCKACEQICPKNAITMSENEEGFHTCWASAFLTVFLWC